MPASATPQPQPVSQDQLAAALISLSETQKAIVANTPAHKLSFSEWLAKHPQPVLPFPLFQNGFRIEADSMPAAGRDLLPKLRTGRFYDRRIHVYQDGTPDRGWHIDYNNKSVEDRMHLMKYGRDIVEILQRLTTETPDVT